MSELPVVVIGAGPQGLAAAAHLLERGLEPLVLEAGRRPGVRGGRVGARPAVLAVAGAGRPGRGAAARARRLGGTGPGLPDRGRVGRRVPAPARGGARRPGQVRDQGDRGVPQGPRPPGRRRAGATSRSPCTSPARTGTRTSWTRGRSSTRRARGGSRTRPARTGCPPSASAPPRDEGLVRYQIPDFAAPEPFAGRHTVVLGAGHSAATAVIELARIARANPGTRVTWALRRATASAATAGSATDELPERGALGIRAGQAVDEGTVTLVTGFRTERIRQDGADRAVLVAEDGRELAPADTVVVLTGFRPDLGFLSELRLDLDPVLQAPRRDRAGDRPERPLLRHGDPHPGGRPGAARAGPVPGGDEVLRPGADVPRDDRLRAGPQRGRRAGRGPRGRRPGPSSCCPTPACAAAPACSTTRTAPAAARAARPPRRCCRSASPRPAAEPPVAQTPVAGSASWQGPPPGTRRRRVPGGGRSPRCA